MRPGVDWPGNTATAWTAETAFFALSDAATGARGRAAALLSWLAAHRTSLGALPEQVTAAGQPASVAPLAWTDAAVLLTLVAQTRRLPAHSGPGTAEGGGRRRRLPPPAVDRSRPITDPDRGPENFPVRARQIRFTLTYHVYLVNSASNGEGNA